MKKIFLMAIVALAICSSCTSNQRVKTFGGTATMDLKPGEKLVTIDWDKSEHIWYLTRPMTASDTAVTYTFQESSNFGVVQGTYIVKEHKIFGGN